MMRAADVTEIDVRTVDGDIINSYYIVRRG